MTRKKPKGELRQLPGVRMSPQTLLHMMLDRVGEMADCVVVWTDKNRFPHTAWSRMSMTDLTWCAAQLNDTAYQARNNLLPDVVVPPKKPAA